MVTNFPCWAFLCSLCFSYMECPTSADVRFFVGLYQCFWMEMYSHPFLRLYYNTMPLALIIPPWVSGSETDSRLATFMHTIWLWIINPINLNDYLHIQHWCTIMLGPLHPYSYICILLFVNTSVFVKSPT